MTTDAIKSSSEFSQTYFECLTNLQLTQEATQFFDPQYMSDYSMILKYYDMSHNDAQFIQQTEGIYSEPTFDANIAQALLTRLKILMGLFAHGHCQLDVALNFYQCLTHALFFYQDSLSDGLKDAKFFGLRRPKARNRIDFIRENFSAYGQSSIFMVKSVASSEQFVKEIYDAVLKLYFLLGDYGMKTEQNILLSSVLVNREIARFERYETEFNFLFALSCLSTGNKEVYYMFLKHYFETTDNEQPIISNRVLYLVYKTFEEHSQMKRLMLLPQSGRIQSKIFISWNQFYVILDCICLLYSVHSPSGGLLNN